MAGRRALTERYIRYLSQTLCASGHIHENRGTTVTIEVRIASISDIDELTRLFDRYRVFYKQESDPELAQSFLTARIENNESKIFVASMCDDSSCGFTQLFRSFSSVSARPQWILNDLYVDKSARRKGVGRLLMNRAREFAVETASKGIYLETGKSNIEAQALYEALGYERIADTYGYFLSLT